MRENRSPWDSHCWFEPDLHDCSVRLRRTFTLVAGLDNGVTNVVAGDYHTCALVFGGVQCWGDGNDGILGNGDTSDSAVPVQVVGLSANVTDLAAGGLHTCAAVKGGVRCWGAPTYGDLGGSIPAGSSETTVQVTGLTADVLNIAVGDVHSCACLAIGVKCWGESGSGQLGDDTFLAQDGPVWVKFP